MVFVLAGLIGWIVASTYMQTSGHPLKKIISPGLTAACGLLVLAGGFIDGVPLGLGLILAVAILLLAVSEFTFERTQDSPRLFVLALGLGKVNGFMIGFIPALKEMVLWGLSV